MIFANRNDALTEVKELKNQRNINSFQDEFDYKKYNNLLEIKKELNEERKSDNNFLGTNNIIFNNTNNLLKFNSIKNIHDNELFHKNLNYELEKNKIKLQKEINFSDYNNNKKQDLNDFLNKINPNSPINNNNEYNDEIEFLKNKISQLEESIDNTKMQYQKQINFYIQQLSNYNAFITIITDFFNKIFKKYIPNYNFNIPNNIIEENKFTPLNTKDIEEKFNKIDQYIYDLNIELNEYKKKNNSTIDKNIDDDKNEIDKFITHNNYIKDSITYSNNNIISSGKDFIFKNEVLSKKVRSKSSSKPRLQYNKKISSNKNLFKNKNSKNDNKLTKRNNSYRGFERNNNLDIIQYTKKQKKKSKGSKNIPIKLNKKNKSKYDTKKVKPINLK